MQSEWNGARIEGGEANTSGPGPQVMAANTLTGDVVMNDAGERLGEIKAIMLDVPHGKIAYAVLSFGGFLGIGEKLFAVPWSALTLDANHHCFLLDASRERLRVWPGFDKNHWPLAADSHWESSASSLVPPRDGLT